MNFSDWLDAKPGRATAVAESFKVSKPAVTHWKQNGVPRGHVLAVSLFTDGEVTVSEMLKETEAALVRAVVEAETKKPKKPKAKKPAAVAEPVPEPAPQPDADPQPAEASPDEEPVPEGASEGHRDAASIHV